MLTYIALVALLASSVLARNLVQTWNFQVAEEHEEAFSLFNKFVKDYSKSYFSEKEAQNRFEIFRQKLEKINQWNAESTDATFGINQFTDMEQHEIYRPTPVRNNGSCARLEIKDISKPENVPDNFDLRDKKVVAPVQDQGQCGSCFVFASISVIETATAIKTGKVVKLSEESVVDCDYTDLGCAGGDPENVFEYVIKNGGVPLEKDYPYEGRIEVCQAEKNLTLYSPITECYVLPDESEVDNDVLKYILLQNSSLNVGIGAGDKFQHYYGGVLELEQADDVNVDHAVVIVGYGNDGSGDYWVIRNSWGPGWGERGHIRVRAHKRIMHITEISFVKPQ